MALYYAFRLAAALARAAPLRLSYAIGAACGLAAYYAWPGGRRRCIANMRHVVADETNARATARRSFANYGLYLVDFLRSTSVSAEEIRARVYFDRWEEVDALRATNGIVVVTLHFGNWDIGAAVIAEHGIPISVVADTFRDDRLNDLVLGARRHLGMEILAAERMAPSILRALRHKAVVALLIDVPPPLGTGVEVDFFGSKVAVADGPARIALRAGAQMVAATIYRDGDRNPRFRTELVPIDFMPSGDAEHDVRTLTQATVRALEPMVAQRPEQWYIFRSLWLDDRERQALARPRA